MSKLARALVLAATLAAMNLAGIATVAQAYSTTGDARHQALAQERYYSTWRYGDAAARQALAQERYYGTWRGGDQATAPARPAASSRQPGWLVVALGMLTVALALVGALAATTTRRARRRVRAHQAA
jgi:hypothetical protein